MCGCRRMEFLGIHKYYQCTPIQYDISLGMIIPKHRSNFSDSKRDQALTDSGFDAMTRWFYTMNGSR